MQLVRWAQPNNGVQPMRRNLTNMEAAHLKPMASPQVFVMSRIVQPMRCSLLGTPSPRSRTGAEPLDIEI